MTRIAATDATPDLILDFWFPAGLADASPQDHGTFWRSRMQGGMDKAICTRFAEVTYAAARGTYDGWADTARGRLALILTLDQFPRSLWRDTPGAYAQDIKATRLALDGIANGHFDALQHRWEKTFYLIAIGHCEGPDHLQRMDLMIEVAGNLRDTAPARLAEFYADPEDQPRRVRAVVARFGRHPHRNAILGRVSTPEEEAYIATGDFPHLP